MGMFKLMWRLIEQLRDKAQALIKYLWNKAQNSESGKLKGINPTNIPKIVMLVFIIIAGILIIVQMTKPEDKINNGLSQFEKEIKPSSSVESRFDGRELDTDVNKALRSVIENSNSQNKSSLVDGLDSKIGGSSEILSVSDCLEVMDKLKKGTKLSDSENSLANQCITENPMGMTPEDIELAKKLVDPNITEAERQFLAKALDGTLSADERKLALALAGNDPEKAEMAKKAINSGDPALISAASKLVSGKELTEEEKTLIANLKNPTAVEDTRISDLVNDGVKTEGSNTEGSSAIKTSVPEDLEQKSVQIAERDKVIDQKEKELERAKKDAESLGSKITEGSNLTDSELKRLQALAEKQKDLEALKKAQATESKKLAEQMAKIKEAMQRSMVTVGSKIPTGVFVEYDGEEQCAPKAKPFVAKKPKKEQLSYVDLDNRPLNPEEVEFIKLMRKDGKKETNDIASGFLGKLGEPLQVAVNGERNVDVASMVLFSDKSIKDCELTSDILIPAQLDSEILVSSNGSSQQVRIKILKDVYCPTNNQQLLIAKGAIGIGLAGTFDADTGVMNMNIEKVVSGGKNLAFRFNVASANGTSGLRGEVRDTTGQYLLGAFIPAFAGAALSYFSQQQVAPYLQSTNAQQALTGAALAGSSEVMNKIAELAASKMLNAAKIFWVPKGIPVVLIPQ